MSTALREPPKNADLLQDGGGIRGLSELILIEELLERLKAIDQLPEVPKPADRFDLIGGTSTGGFVSATITPFCLSC